MKEETLKGFIKWFQEEVNVVDAVAQVTLKGHLRIEESLTEIISLYLFHPEYLEDAGLRFYQKLKIARGLALRKHDFPIWNLIAAINALRNDMAHSKSSPKRQEKISTVRQLYLKEIETLPEHSKHSKAPDEQVLAFACGLSLGFLQNFHEDSIAYKKHIDALDKKLNG